MFGNKRASSLGLVIVLAFVPLLGGCANEDKELVVYDEERTKDQMVRLEGIGYGLVVAPGFKLDVTNFNSDQTIDRKVKLPRLPRVRQYYHYRVYVPRGEEEKFKSIGGAISLKLVGKGRSWGWSGQLDSLIICTGGVSNYMYICDITVPDVPRFVPEYAHIIYKPDKTSINMPVKVIFISGGER